jgi:hypothetical protein
MIVELNNPLLQQVADGIESGLSPESRADYDQVVAAGIHAASDGTMTTLKKSQDPISDAATGAVLLVMLLHQQAHSLVPMKTLVLAATALMLRALDFVDQAGIVKVAEPELVRAAHILGDAIFALLGITPAGGPDGAAQRLCAIAQDPELLMAAIKLRADLAHGAPTTGAIH